MDIFFLFFISYLMTEISTPYIIDLFIRKGIVDKPEARKIHNSEIPRMGGVVIYSVFIILFQAFYQDINSVKLFFTGSIVIFICGIIDDLYDLDWRVKFAIQSIGGIILLMRFTPVFNGIIIFGIEIPAPFNYALLFFFIIGTMNSINLMDGLDGLTSGFSILAIFFIGFLALYKGYALLIIITSILLGSLLSFLKFNSYPAKIFLGDSGSLVLGYFLVFLSIEILRPFGTKPLDLTFPVLLLGVPIIDTLKVMYLRMREGRLPFTPDKKHLHHVIFGIQVRHKTTVFIIHLLSILFMINALLYLRFHSVISIIVFALLGSLLLFAKYFTTLTNKSIIIFKRLTLHAFELPIYAVNFFRKVVVKVSFVVVFFVLLFEYKYFPDSSAKVVFIMMAGGAILFIVAIQQYLKNNNLITIYVFFNLLFFFSVNLFLQDSYVQVITSVLSINRKLINFPFYLITLVVIIFLIGRYSLLPSKNIFFNGMDLSIISFSLMFFILQPFSQWDTTSVNHSLITSLVVYIWFKVFNCFYTRAAIIIYFGFFILNFSTLVFSLIF